MWFWNKKMLTVGTIIIALQILPGFTLAEPVEIESRIFEELGFSSTDRKKLMKGEFVSIKLNTTHERELAVAFAFLVKLPVADLREAIQKQPLIATDSQTIQWSPISKDGSLEDFKTLNLRPNEAKRAMKYINVKPGDILNLNEDEITAFNAIQASQGLSPVKPVTETVKEQLLNRFQSYQQAGLSGISPYQREQGTTSVEDYLKGATETLSTLKVIIPDFYQSLINYPEDKPSQLSEEFAWLNYNAHGEPVFILTHNLQMADAGIFVTVQRQFYVSGSYNSGQSISAFIPINNETETLVFYVNRVFTDKLTGFALALKQSMGNQIMISQLRQLFNKARIQVEKNKTK